MRSKTWEDCGNQSKRYDDPVQSEFLKVEKNIRKALKQGIVYRVIEKPDNISSFKRYIILQWIEIKLAITTISMMII